MNVHCLTASVAALAAGVLAVHSAAGGTVATLTTLHEFPYGIDEGFPVAGLVQGTDGNFYGTTGGDTAFGHSSIVFKMTLSGTLTTLHTFSDGSDGDGSRPWGSLVQGTDGNFYGTTTLGGTKNGGAYSGAVFKMTPGGLLTILHSFSGSDGYGPCGSLVQGTDSNFYGTTTGGGANGGGTVFRITAGGTLTTLHAFGGGSSVIPSEPCGSLVQGTDGNFYGMTGAGGANGNWGTVFKMTPSGTLTILHSFSNGSDGAFLGQGAGLVQGMDGNFYGMTPLGGANGFGTVFRITAGGTFTTLYTFSAGSDGGYPGICAGLVQDSGGNFYGTTKNGGANAVGTIFMITAGGTLTTLYSLPQRGGSTEAGVVQGSDGSFYGTTRGNGTYNNQGTIFRLDVIKTNQAALVFNPASPQAYNTTNALMVTGGSGSGPASYAVQSGPGQIVGGSNLRVTAGSGTVVVVATKAADALYYAIAATGQVVAAKAAQAITFPAIPDQGPISALDLSATASSGLPVAFMVFSGPAQINGGTNLTFTGAGTVSIVASQAGDANWNPATAVTNTFNVIIKNQTINFPAIPTQRTNNLVGLSATASSGLTVSFAVGSGPGTIAGGTNLSFTGVGDVRVVASQAGNGNWNAANVTNVVKVYALSIGNGPYAGGNLLTITNGSLGGGSDITNLLVGGRAATIQTQGVNWVKITLPAATSTGAKDIVIQSTTVGSTVFSNAYTYNPAGNIFTVSPVSGSYAGGYQVVIAGTNLGDGSDITNVTLCGSNVASINSQSATQVVITAGAGTGGIGDVAVYSVRYGTTIKSSAFWYSVSPQNISVTDGAYTNMVRVTWNASPGATGYEVWRNLINSIGTATHSGNTSSSVYDDSSTASGVTNYYWVKATNSYGTSSFSSSDSGWRQPPAPGVVAFSAASYTVNKDTGNLTLTVTRSGGSDGAASVNYSTQNGTAIAGVDYVASSGTFSWADFESAAKTITVTIINRSGKQDDRVFTVGLSGASTVTIVSPSSSSVTIRDLFPPSPSGVTASKGATKGVYSNQVWVYWNYVPAYFSASYKVWRGTDSNVQNASLLVTNTTIFFYFDTSANPNVPYHYWIQTVNTAGTSDFSVPDSGYCGSISDLACPTGVQATKGGFTDRIRVAWQAVDRATHYEVWRNTGNDPSSASLISGPTGTSYDDYSVSQGARYYYWLKARTAYLGGNFSDPDAGWPGLSTPSGVRASNGSYPYHIQVAWNAVAGAAWYDVWREEVPGSNSALTQVAQTGELIFNDYQTKSGVYYNYKVKACNELCSSLDYGQMTGRRQVNASPTSLSAINDYDGDKLSDLSMFSPSSGVLDVLCSALGRQAFVLGAENSQGVTGDYDGDRITDPAAYCPDSGTWLVRLSSTGYNPTIRVVFGGNGDNPVAADFDGDGLADMGAYDETNGVLSVMLSNGGDFDRRASCLIGGPGWRFISSDFDGDGLADPTAYSESEGRATILLSGSGYASVSVALGGQGMSMYAADFDGDGLSDPVLYEQATGIWTVLLSSAGYRAAKISFGGPGYAPVIGDYDGDGLADPAIYRKTNGQWLIMFSVSNYSVITETFGSPEYQPITR